jgi:chromosome segregation ATPase
MSDLLPPKTHNLPALVAPTEVEFLEYLKTTHADVDLKLVEFEKAFNGYPKTLTLADEEIATAMQDFIKQMDDYSAVLAARKKREKGPWDKIVKVVQNFFTKAEDKIGDKKSGWIGELRVVHQQYLDLKAADNERKARELAQRQKEEADRLAKDAAEAAERKAKAEAEAEAARVAEEKARERQRIAEEEERAAKQRAEEAIAKEKAAAEERKAKEKAEREVNGKAWMLLRLSMKTARRLHNLCEADDASEAEIKELDDLILPGGPLSKCFAVLSHSTLLDADELGTLAEFLTEAKAFREASNARFGKREQKRREKAAAEQAALEEQQRKDREAERERIAAAEKLARENREKAEAEVEAAKLKKADAVEDVRDAREEHREASGEAKQAGREEKSLTTDADRASNRATRLTARIDNSSEADFSRTRGDLGTVGSLSRIWTYQIVDEAALRAVCGPLGEHLMTSDLEGASYRFMRAHQSGFTGERVENLLPGVVFMWERNTRIA